MRTMRWVVAVALLCTVGSALQAAEMPSQEDLQAAAGDQSGSPGPLQVGEEVSREVASPAVARGDGSKPVWTYQLTDIAGSYIAPHFSYFNLPQGAKLVIASPDGSRKWEYTGTGKGELGLKDGFWGIHIAGDTAVLRLFSAVDLPAGVIRIDKYARGYHIPGDFESLCGTDDSGWAPCYQTSHPGVYNKARAVARLLISGTSLCTGWLVGSDGHVMTNEHCINTMMEAANTDFEFMAEGATCTTNCPQMGCPGTIVATSSVMVQFNAALDYALVKLPVNPTSTYGFLQMRNNGTNAGEKIYIPQHPQGFGKKIALFSTHPNDTSGHAEIQSTNRPACNFFATHLEVGYYADTQGGSSGSPVIGLCDHTVVALHHCGNCPNLGVPMELIIQDLDSAGNLPPNGTANNSWSCGECGPGYCKQGEYCDGVGCYPASSTISRAICQCGLTAPQCGFGACYGGENYCEGPNCQWPVCYINTAPASQIFCAGMHLDPFCNVIP